MQFKFIQYIMKFPIDLQPLDSEIKDKQILTLDSNLISRHDSINSIEEQVHQKLHLKIMDTSDIYQNLLMEVEKLVQKTELDQDLVILLLKKYKWNQELLQNSYFSQQNCDDWIQKLESKKKHKIEENLQECPVCQNIKPMVYSVCNHGACLSCWRSYFEAQMSDKAFFKCINDSCFETVYHSFILRILDNTNKYIQKLSIDYANTVKSVSACPGVDCQLFFQDSSLLTKSIYCQCGTRYCFKCKQEPHEPCPCKQKEQWIALTMTSKPNETWIKGHTKQCPGCTQRIQKSLGCNMMSCKCGISFCYVCSKPWQEAHKDHFKCPFSIEQCQLIPSSQQIHKITSVYSKFIEINCMEIQVLKSLESCNDIGKLIEKKLQVNEQDTLFLKELCRTIIKGYSFLKWTLVLCHLKRQTIRFEDLLEFRFQKLKEQIVACNHLLKQLMQKFNDSQSEEVLQGQNKSIAIKAFYYQKSVTQRITKHLSNSLKYFTNETKNI